MKERRRFNRFNLSVLAGAIFVIMGLLSQNGHAVQKHPVHKHKHKHKEPYKHKRWHKHKASYKHKAHKTPVITSNDSKPDDNSLRQAILEALSNNPNINADIASKQEAIQRIEQAKAGYYPTLDARAAGGYGYLRNKLSPTKINGGAHGTVVSDRYDMSLSVKQMVFDGLDTPHRVEKASREELQSSKKINETRELVAFNAAREYITLRRFQRLVRLAEENIKQHQTVLAKVRAQVNAGRTTIADVQHVEARLADAKASLQDIKGDLESAIARYIELMGHAPGTLRKVSIPRNLLPVSLEAALEAARRSNRSLEVANASVEVAKADLSIMDTPFYPSLFLESDAQRSFNGPGEKGNQTTLSALAVVRYNLFNGGRDIAKKREYIERVTEAKFKRDGALRRADREVRVSWAEMVNAHKQAEALRSAVVTKNQVRQTFLSQFDLGTRSFLEILDATHEEFLAKGSLITADASEDIASLRLLATMGSLAEIYAHPEMSQKKSETVPAVYTLK